MRGLGLFILVAVTASAGRFDRFNSRCEGGRSDRGLACDAENYAFFEFAPASGAGMGTACSCTTPTGAKGEAMTFTRTGDATCSKQGLATTGIANGDLVVCAANQPRVESSGGVLGLRVEGARTNSTARSQQLDNAAWSTAGSTPSAPTITADYATAPDGTTTAERLQFPAVTGGESSGIFESVACPASAARMTIYVRGVSTSGNVCLWANDAANATNCAFTNTGWTRCQTATGGTAAALVFGNLGSIAGCVGANAAQDIVAWGAQCEAGAYATSYIPTVASAVTRNAEAAYLSMASTQVGSVAATAQVPYPSSASVGTNRRILRTDVGGSDNDRYELYWPANATVIAGVLVGGVGGATPTTAFQTVPGTFRVAGWRTPGSTAAVIIGGTQTTAADALAAFPNMNRVYLGVYAPSAGFELDGIVSQVQVDPSIARAR